jgi:FkbM family methyltransferase
VSDFDEMAYLGWILRVWPNAAWYAGRLGTIVRVQDCAIAAPNRYLAGAMRLGGFEIAEQQALRYLDPTLPVIELGCGIGVIACLTNRRLRDPAAHLCVDGNVQALALAVENGVRNGCRFSTLHAALAYDTQTVSFGSDENVLYGGIGTPYPTSTVPAVTLADLIGRTGFQACTLICDIEGAESEMLEREGHVIRAHVRHLMMELHPSRYGEAGVRRIRDGLAGLGFHQKWERASVSVWETSADPPSRVNARA